MAVTVILRVRNLDGVVLSEDPHPVTMGVCDGCGALLSIDNMKPCRGLLTIIVKRVARAPDS